MRMRIGIIGGSGLEGLYDRQGLREQCVDTRYGQARVYIVTVGGREVIFLPRHNKGHDLPPHKINYRANIRALETLGCHNVIATNAVGGLASAMEPGEFVVVDQFLDFTRQRPLTFFDGEDGQVHHVDMTYPYCPRLRNLLTDAAEAEGLGGKVHPAGTYVCCEGPRFETPAEIRMFAQLGADVVGMTGVPEVVLAREAGLCYASVCIITNWAAGLRPSLLAHTEFIKIMDQVGEELRGMLRRTIAELTDDPQCQCRKALI